MPSNKKCWGGSYLSITAKYKFYFTNVSIKLSVVGQDVACRPKVSWAAELNFHFEIMLYYALLTNTRPRVKQDTRKSSVSNDD